MTNMADCPNCEKRIDATQAALNRECPACYTNFYKLLGIAAEANNDREKTEYYQYE